jgi:hypothetical protein
VAQLLQGSILSEVQTGGNYALGHVFHSQLLEGLSSANFAEASHIPVTISALRVQPG